MISRVLEVNERRSAVINSPGILSRAAVLRFGINERNAKHLIAAGADTLRRRDDAAGLARILKVQARPGYGSQAAFLDGFPHSHSPSLRQPRAGFSEE